MIFEKTDFVWLIAGASAIFLAGMLAAGLAITSNAFWAIVLMVVLIPMAKVILPFVMVRVIPPEKISTIDVWQEVKTSIFSELSLSLPEWYIPKDRRIYMKFRLFVCRINSLDLQDADLQARLGMRTPILVVVDYRTKGVLKCIPSMDIDTFERKYLETHPEWFEVGSREEMKIQIPSYLAQQPGAAPIVIQTPEKKSQ